LWNAAASVLHALAAFSYGRICGSLVLERVGVPPDECDAGNRCRRTKTRLPMSGPVHENETLNKGEPHLLDALSPCTGAWPPQGSHHAQKAELGYRQCGSSAAPGRRRQTLNGGGDSARQPRKDQRQQRASDLPRVPRRAKRNRTPVAGRRISLQAVYRPRAKREAATYIRGGWQLRLAAITRPQRKASSNRPAGRSPAEGARVRLSIDRPTR
jgi:hypothetical protein